MHAIIIHDLQNDWVLELPRPPNTVHDLLESVYSAQSLAKIHHGRCYPLSEWLQDYPAPQTKRGNPVFGQLFEVADADVGPNIPDCG